MGRSLTVRSWRGALNEREAERHDVSSYDSPGIDDHHLEADYSRRIHELRGIFMAQAAELEDLLIELVDQIVRDRPELLPPKTKTSSMIPVSRALTIVGQVVMNLDDLDYLRDGLSMIRWAIARRNQLVHSMVRVGYSQIGDLAPREPVIVYLSEIRQGGLEVPWEHAPTLQDAPNPGDWAWQGDLEIGTRELESDIRRLYKVLDAAVDIYEDLSAQLGSTDLN